MIILIAGDLSLQNRAGRCLWDENQKEKAFSSVKYAVSRCDLALVNLESPVTENNKPLLKDGPTLKNPYIVFDLIKYCGFRAVTLANNHLKDYGSKGVIDTIRTCQKEGLEIVGAGQNISSARNFLKINDGILSVGIINVCEHESSIATRMFAGANPLDFSNLYYDITELRHQVDKVVVIVHGGREHYQLPTPRMKREYHLIADFGADEPIFYGIGNFFFDNPLKRNDKWNYGLLLKLNLEMDKVTFEIIPFEQCNEEPVINELDYATIKDDIEKLSAVIADDGLLEEAFISLVKSTRPMYPFLPYSNHYLRALYNREYLPDLVSKQNKVKIENAVNCETHRELLLRYFEIILHDEQNQ